MLIFLATIVPLDERSGVNLTGALNTSHSTPVEDVPEVAPAPPLIHLPEAPLPSFTGALRHQPNVREVTPPCAMQSHTVCWPTGLPAWLVRARGALCMVFSTSDASGALAEEGASWVGRAIRACVLSSALP